MLGSSEIVITDATISPLCPMQEGKRGRFPGRKEGKRGRSCTVGKQEGGSRIEKIEKGVAVSQLGTSNIIRERRERTGFSQRKFADILGISREHLNKIEAGEREPSEALLERLDYFLQFYDPEAKVDIMLDYVRIRFRTTDAVHVIEKIMRIKLKYMLFELHAFYGYEAQYYYGDIVVLVSSDDDKGCLLELKGHGCRQFESILLCQKRDWIQFLAMVKSENAVIKRIDIAINDRVGILDITEMTGKLKRHEYTSIFKQYKFYESGVMVKEDEGDGGARGNTLYIGSLKSDIYFCIYEKDYEQYIKYGISMETADIRNRFEIRLKDDRAQVAVSSLIECNDVGEIAFGIVNRYLTFLMPVAGKEKRSWDIDPRWEQFMQQGAKKVRLTIEPEKCDALGDKLNWITKQCAPTLKAIRMLDASLGEDDRINKIIDAAQISSNMQKLIEQELIEIEEIVN